MGSKRKKITQPKLITMSKSNYELEQENKALNQQLMDFKKLAEEAPSVRAVGKIISGPD